MQYVSMAAIDVFVTALLVIFSAWFCTYVTKISVPYSSIGNESVDFDSPHEAHLMLLVARLESHCSRPDDRFFPHSVASWQ